MVSLRENGKVAVVRLPLSHHVWPERVQVIVRNELPVNYLPTTDSAGPILTKLQAQIHAMYELVDKQAEDAELWFEAQTAPEAYLQQALRRLHAAIEGKTPEECAEEVWDGRVEPWD